MILDILGVAIGGTYIILKLLNESLKNFKYKQSEIEQKKRTDEFVSRVCDKELEDKLLSEIKYADKNSSEQYKKLCEECNELLITFDGVTENMLKHYYSINEIQYVLMLKRYKKIPKAEATSVFTKTVLRRDSFEAKVLFLKNVSKIINEPIYHVKINKYDIGCFYWESTRYDFSNSAEVIRIE